MFKHYLTTALRNFRRSPYVAGINVLGLALGLACFIAAYGSASYLQNSDRHFENADRIYAISQRISSEKAQSDTGARPTTSPLVAKYLQQDFPELESIARLTSIAEVTASSGDRKSFVTGMAVDADFLRIFNFSFLAGGDRDALRRPRSLILTEKAARNLFGATNVVGKTVLLKNAVEVTVTGVLGAIPKPSQFDDSPTNFMRFDALVSWDVFEDLQALAGRQRTVERPESDLWSNFSGPTYVLLPDNQSLTSALMKARLRDFARLHVARELRESSDYQFDIVPVSNLWLAMIDATLFKGSGVSIAALLKLLGALVLLTACLNYANLATAQAMTRAKEIGLRRVLGAGRGQVAIQHLFEASLSTIGATLIALATVAALAPLLERSLGVGFYAATSSAAAICAFLAALIAAVTFAAGFYPIVVLSRVRPRQTLQGAKPRSLPSVVPHVLVGAQFAVASLLMIAIIVIARQNGQLQQTGLGSSSAATVVIATDLRSFKVDFNTLRSELLRSPAVKAVGAIDKMPWSFNADKGVVKRATDSADLISPFRNMVAGDFFASIDARILAGRALDRSFGGDLWPAPGTRNAITPEYNIVIDVALANRLGWSDPAKAVDQTIVLPRGAIGLPDQPIRIVGVVADKSLRLIGSGTVSNMYLLVEQGARYPIVRIDERRLAEGLAAIDAAWSSLAPTVPLRRQFIDDMFEQSYEIFRRVNRIAFGVTVFAFAIASMGLFGIAAFVASRRAHEIGVRKTLGASTSQIVTLLLRDFSKPVLIANLMVWPLAYLAVQAYLKIFAQRIALTPLPFVGSLIVALLIACLAVGAQTLRAARAHPATMLRYE